MAGKLKSKIKLLFLKEILERYSDEQHVLNSQDIAERLHNEYGVDCERKSIYSDIDVLLDYGMDIIRTHTPKNGFFLASGDFQLTELRLLSDAVQAAQFITVNKTKELLQKIEGLTSIYQADTMRRQIYIEKRRKSSNESVYYVIDRLDEAIKKKKKVRVEYSKRKLDEKFAATKETREHVLSPYALIWTDDHYYLVANNEKYNNLMHLRIDRISRAEILTQKARSFEEVSEYKNNFDPADYVSKHFQMYSGKPEMIELCCSNDILEQMLDRFGERVHTRFFDETHFLLRTEAAVTKGLVAWIMQFGNKMTVRYPKGLVCLVRETAKSILSNYPTEASSEEEDSTQAKAESEGGAK